PSSLPPSLLLLLSTRSANGLLLNMMMMSDENHRDIYISTVAVPPPRHCPGCRDMALAHPGEGPAHCLRHGFMLHTKYQVVYPFPTFQPAFQLKKDQVVLLNTSYSLVACAVAVHAAGDNSSCQILYERRNSPAPCRRPGCAAASTPIAARAAEREAAAPAQPVSGQGLTGEDGQSRGGSGLSPAVAKAKEFVADIFRRAKEATGPAPGGEEEEEEEEAAAFRCRSPISTSTPPCLAGSGGCRLHPASPQAEGSPPNDPPTASPGPPSASSPTPPPPEPGYVNYTKLRYVLEPGEAQEEFEDDKISLPFVVTDLRGRSLKPLKERATAQGQCLTVEQLTLDFEYVINEVIRNDAAWSRQFCSFSDYDIVILEVCPETNQVIINIGLLLLAFPSPDEEGQLRPKTYHTSLKVAWDLNTGTFVTVSVGDLTEVKGQT
ncbi:DCA15 factor, partial [Atlantisia rogersi]|nr:DCA15 factor [Atlantisia rogersi]